MTSFAEKSQQSLQAADMLFKGNLYPSTVNRAYYGFHQYMMHILFTKLGKKQDEFEKDINFYDKGTHTLVWNIVGPAFAKIFPNDVSEKEWRSDYKWLQEKVKEFKKLRTDADYKETTIAQEDASEWLDKARSMINLLNKGFK